MQSRTADVAGTPVRWLEQGAGTPVVLVHGLPTSPALWRHVVPLLPGVRVLALELTGYGESVPAGVDRDLSVSAQADRLLAWVEQLGLGPVVLVGHDVGGGVAHVAAVRRPDLCAGLAVVDAVGYDAWPVPEVRAVQVAAPVVSRLPGAALLPGIAAAMVRGHHGVRSAREALRLHARPYLAHGGAALARQVRALDVRDTLAVQDLLPALDRPARVVWGTADPFLPVRYGERFARDLGTVLRRIEGGRHFTPEDHPEVVAEEVRSLVAEVAG